MNPVPPATRSWITRPWIARPWITRLVVASAACLAIVRPAAAEPATPATERPNVLFLAVDDLRPELNCYGADHVVSPHIDRLAQAGVQFDRAYCMVSVCGASRASLMTGIRPSPNRFVGYLARADRDAPGITTMNTHFRQHGYYTVSLGKIFHVSADNQGGWSEKPWRPRRSFTYRVPANMELHRKRQRQGGRLRGPPYEAGDVEDEAYGDGALAKRAVEVLQRLSKQDQPFFLAVGFFKPHLPFVEPKKYWDLYDPADIDLPPNAGAPKNAPRESLHNSGELRAYAGIPRKGPIPRETARKLIHGYYACVSYTDAQIGKVLSALDRLGLSDNTVVVLWSDHGWNLGEHGLWCKHCCYETSMRIPLIVRAPGKRSGTHCKRLIESIDLYPTLCELAGLPVPQHVEGSSFVKLLDDPNAPHKSTAVGRYGRGDTIKTARYRYTEYRSKPGKLLGRMLYDHERDPGETTNIVDQEAVREAARDLAQKLNEIKGRDRR